MDNATITSSASIVSAAAFVAAPPVVRRKAALKSSSAMVAVLTLPVAALSLGVILTPPAQAATTLSSSGSTAILGNYNTGNPFTVNPNTTISASSGDGVFGNSNTPWTLTNYGALSGGTANGVGFGDGGTLINTINVGSMSVGLITGATDGAYMDGAAGTVVNAGTIIGNTFDGIDLRQGGSVNNGGEILGAADGVDFGVAYGILVNSNEIIAGNGTAGVGARFTTGSVVTSGYIAGATGISMSAGGGVYNEIGGYVRAQYDGVRITGAAGSVANDGTIFVNNLNTVQGHGIYLGDGGSVTNTASASVTAYGAGVDVEGASAIVQNYGNITGMGNNEDGAGTGVRIGAGGYVGNHAGTIFGSLIGVGVTGIGSIYNSGSIYSWGTGVTLASGGSVGNTGSIFGTIAGAGFGTYGTLVNSGLISGEVGASFGEYSTISNTGTILGGSRGVVVTGGAGYVTNSGTIMTGGSFSGLIVPNLPVLQAAVTMNAGGTVVNASGGYIGGADYGVAITGPGAAYVTNASDATISSNDGEGVYLNGVGNSVVNAGSIFGGGYGAVVLGNGGSVTNASGGQIFAPNYGVAITGVGAAYVTNASDATITSFEGDGVYLEASGGNVVNAGSIFGGGYGAVLLDNGGTVTNQFGGQIYGNNYGVVTSNGTAAVSNDGTIGGAYGGLGLNFGSVTNSSSAVITGGRDGIYLYNGSVNNSGLIQDTGAYPTGRVNGAGVYLYNGGTVVNNAGGTIVAMYNSLDSGGEIGVVAYNGAVTVDNSGLIDGGLGVGLHAGGTVTNQSTGLILGEFAAAYITGAASLTNFAGGTIQGLDIGVVLGSLDTNSIISAPRTIDNAGLIEGGGVGVLIEGGYITNAVGGIISGGSLGISSGGGPLYLNNAGLVQGTTGVGVEFGGGTINNEIGGTIGGYINGVVGEPSTFVTSIDNSGLIAGTNGDGVLLINGGIIGNELTGTITGGVDGVAVDNAPAYVGNAGSISGMVGVAMSAGGSVSNAATGVIYGSQEGVYLTGGGSVSNAMGGTITGGSADGVGINGATGYVSNSGSIDGARDGVRLTAGGTVFNAGGTISGGQDGVGLTAGGNVTNAVNGIISGPDYGVLAQNVAASVSNAGMIDAEYMGVNLFGGSLGNAQTGTIDAGFVGVYFENSGSVVNNGLIQGAGLNYERGYIGDTGVYLRGGGTLINNAAGTIMGGVNQENGGFGVIGRYGFTSITNSGEISGYTGVEIRDGALTNGATGQINGVDDGAVVQGTAPSLINIQGGTISGGDAGAVVVSYYNNTVNSLASTSNAGVIEGEGAGLLAIDGGTINNTTSAVISGGSVGIGAYGVGTVNITNAGLVQSYYGIGALILSGGSVTNLASGTIIGPQVGIVGGSSLALAVYNSGLITGATGVYLGDGGLVSNSMSGVITGDLNGVVTDNVAATVVNGGLIAAENPDAGTGVQLNAGGSVTNNAGGTIAGDYYGVVVQSAVGYVSNAGSIGGGAERDGVLLADGGSVANSGTIASNNGSGVYIENGGGVSNVAGGTIYGATHGVLIAGGVGYVNNAGTIASNAQRNFGVGLADGGSVTNNGLITGGGGVFINGGSASLGSVVNNAGGTISGYYIGVFTDVGTGSVSNAGLVTASTGFGVSVDGDVGGVVDNLLGGTIAGHVSGVFIYPPGSLQNAGVITGSLYAGAYLYNGGTVTNSGTITGGMDGILLGQSYYAYRNSGTVVNSGTVIGGEFGITGAGTLFAVQNSGLIEGGIGVSLSGGPLTLGNTGTIIGTTYDAVDLPDGGSVTNSGAIMGAANGIVSAAPVTVANSGVIEGTGAAGYGLMLGAGGSVSNAAGGLISGGAGGIAVAQYAALVSNSGSIVGGTGDAVDLSAGGTVSNAAGGVITASGGGVVLGAEGSVGNAGMIGGGVYGVELPDGGNLTNSGSIGGGTDGVVAADVVVNNSGTITGTANDGVMLMGGALVNAPGGFIKGGTDGLYAGAGANISNGGTIEDDSTAGAVLGDDVRAYNNGGGEIAGATGVAFTGTGATLVDYGTLASTDGGDAVSFDQPGTNVLTLSTGAVVVGNIDGGGSNSEIDLVGRGLISNTITDFGAGSSLTVEPGAKWTAIGNWQVATVVNLGTFQAGILNPDPPLVLQGNFVQMPGATLQVVVTPTLSTQFLVSGTAKIAGTLNYVFTPGTYMPKTYNFLTAAGGVTGSFATINYSGDVPPTIAVRHDTNGAPAAYQLVLSRGAGVPGMDGATVVTPTDDAVFGAEAHAEATDAQLANDSLLGHADAATSGDDAGREAACQAAMHTPNGATGTMGQMANAMASAFCGAGGWLEATGTAMHVDADGAAPAFHADTGGFLAGIDKAVDAQGGRVGVAVGYDETWLHDSAQGKGTVGTTRVGLYGAQPVGRFTIAADFMYGHASNNTVRETGVGAARASYDSNIIAGAAQISTGMEFNGFALTPAAGVRFAHVDGQGFGESGAGYVPLFSVSGTSPDYTSVQPFVKLGVSKSFVTPNYLVITPAFTVGYDYEAGDKGRSASVASTDGTAFATAQNRLDASTANVSAGISVGRGNFSLYARYNAYLSGNWTAQTGEAGIAVKF